MRYYLTQRPPMPGAIPSWRGANGVKPGTIACFDKRRFCEDIGREAWGYVEYEPPLDPKLAKQYELFPASEKKESK